VETPEPQWLVWARELQAIAQNGLTFSRDDYDIARYHAVRAIAASMMAAGSGTDPALILDLFTKQSGYATPKIDVRGAVFATTASCWCASAATAAGPCRAAGPTSTSRPRMR
jgi:Hydrolase of X-linked nucleoside diphosphate N terminal